MNKFLIVCFCVSVGTVTASGYRQAPSRQQSSYEQASTSQQNGYGQVSAKQQSNYGNVNSGNTDTNEQPMPYNFSYQFVDDDGNRQARDETADGTGAVHGSYQFANVDGIQRTVQYVADDTGFHATIKTNEPGTDNKNPADVEISANPMEVAQQVQGKNGGSYNQQQPQARNAYSQGQINQQPRMQTANGYGQRKLQGQTTQQNQYKGSVASTNYGQRINQQQFNGNVQNQYTSTVQQPQARKSSVYRQTQPKGRTQQQDDTISSSNYGQRHSQQYGGKGQNQYQSVVQQQAGGDGMVYQRSNPNIGQRSQPNKGSGLFGRMAQTGYTKSYQN